MTERIRRLGLILGVTFCLLLAALTRLQVVDASKLSNDPRNTRALTAAFSAERGLIQTIDGVLLARSVPSADEFKRQREYPEGALFAPVTGYLSFTFGADGAERAFNNDLTGGSLPKGDDSLRNLFAGKKRTADVTLTINMDDADHFITDPAHEARVEGTIKSPLVGGETPVQSGTFNLLVHAADPRKKNMHYRLFAKDTGGRDLTLTGVKHIQNDEGTDAWQDTTTLYVKLFDGVVREQDEANAVVRGAGIIRIEILDFLQQMTTFRTEGPSLGARVSALNRFGMLFLGKLWDVYGRPVANATPS